MQGCLHFIVNVSVGVFCDVVVYFECWCLFIDVFQSLMLKVGRSLVVCVGI